MSIQFLLQSVIAITPSITEWLKFRQIAPINRNQQVVKVLFFLFSTGLSGCHFTSFLCPVDGKAARKCRLLIFAAKVLKSILDVQSILPHHKFNNIPIGTTGMAMKIFFVDFQRWCPVSRMKRAGYETGAVWMETILFNNIPHRISLFDFFARHKPSLNIRIISFPVSFLSQNRNLHPYLRSCVHKIL